MTQMQQFDGTEHITMYNEPERTSIAAILGLVLSCIGCCGGITAIPGVFLSIFGIVGISRAKGRLGGMGFAIAGLLIGLLTLALWGGIVGAGVFGVRQMDTAVVQPMFGVLGDIESDDFDAARAGLGSPAADASDEEMIAFREGYQAMLGSVVSTPKGLVDWVRDVMEFGGSISQFSGKSNMIPIPMEFDQGKGLVLIFFDQNQANSGAPVATEIVVFDEFGNSVSLPAGIVKSLPVVVPESGTDSDLPGDGDGAGDDSVDGP
ncbi:MAG: DUF4190 domain-containing protein [Phycisphaerales bacterium]|nr:DUF4190 domain-containing protein [Phycisphaerales bacterium]